MAQRKSAAPAEERSTSEVRIEQAELAASQGYVGDKVDPVPNEEYTIAGVLARAAAAEKGED
jgi:hypothetical protein